MAFNLVQNCLGQAKPLIFTIHTGETITNKYTKQNELFTLPSTWLNRFFHLILKAIVENSAWLPNFDDKLEKR